jgi:predicted RNase H-like nuclease (RuvC/YqgF family)
MKLTQSLLGLFKSLNTEIESVLEPKAEVVFEQVVDSEGTEINISSREVGAEAILAGEPLKDGTYTLTDGFKFTVKDGKIDTIEAEVEKVEDESPIQEALTEEVTEEAPKNEEIDALKAEVESLKSELQSIKEAISGLSTKEDVSNFSSEVKTLSENISLLAAIPMQQSKTNQSFKVESKKAQDFEKLRGAFSGK